MLPRTDTSIAGSRSVSAVSSQQCLDDSASSASTDRTFVVGSCSEVCTPSPAPLLCVSLTFSPPACRHSLLSALSPIVVDEHRRSPVTKRTYPYPPTLCTVSACGGAVDRCVLPQSSPAVTTTGKVSTPSNIPNETEDRRRCFECSSPGPEPREDQATDDDLFGSSYSHPSGYTSRERSRRASHTIGENWSVLWSHVFPSCIAGYLCLRDVINVSQVCRMANQAVQHPWVWRSLAVHHHGIQPIALERTFSIAAQEWGQENPTVATQRVGAGSCHAALTGTSRPTAQRCLSLVPESTANTAIGDDDTDSQETEMWASRALTHSNDSDRFHTVQSLPHVETVMSASYVHTALATPAASFPPASVDEVVDSMPRPDRQELPHGPSSRFLWQTTAAAMPSPSSPVSSSLEDDEAAIPQAVTHVAALPREVAAPCPSSSSPRLTVASEMTFIANGQCGSTAMGPGEATEEGPSSEKWRSLLWVTAQENLPPPSPAQLGDAVASVERRTRRDASPLGSLSRHSLRCNPSYATGVSAEMSGDGAASVVPLTLLSSASTTRDSRQPHADASPRVFSFILCRATAERTLLRSAPEFPWKAFTQFIHMNRIQRSLSHLTALSNMARAELCRGGAWYAAYGALSRAIHVLFQSGSCCSVEHLSHLAETLVRRASLCRHRGHLYVLAAFTDLSVAWMLCPDRATSADLAELCTREELSNESPATWLQRCNDAAHVASPVALLSMFGQVPALFPQNRALCFCSVITFYLSAKRTLRHSLTHLLCRAIDFLTPGTEEEVLVAALREVTVAQQSHDLASAQKACATADYALSLLPLHVRNAAETLTAAWMRDCFALGCPAISVITKWSSTAPESIFYIESTPLEVRWLAWLVCEVQWFTYEELVGPLPGHTALLSIVFAPTVHSRADALVRLSMQYANADVRSEDLQPALPYGTSRGHLAHNLLSSALQLRPLHSTAALLLSRMHTRDAASVEGAHAVLTDSIHAWAQRYSLLGMCGVGGLRSRTELSDSQSDPGAEGTVSPNYLHRRDRRPEICFIPSELLIERSRCLCTIADMAEATGQHPSLSYPYQMRAAMAMDRGYHLAAVMELQRIIALTMDANDIALQVRFLQDAIAMVTSPTEGLEAPVPATEGIGNPAAVAYSPGDTEDSGINDGELVLPSTTSTLPHSPRQLLSHYRSWMARFSGLLALLRPSEPAGPGFGQQVTHFHGRERRMDLGSAWGSSHSDVQTSRAASIAFSDVEEEEILMRVATEKPNAACLRAFFSHLFSPIADPLALAAFSNRVPSSVTTP